MEKERENKEATMSCHSLTCWEVSSLPATRVFLFSVHHEKGHYQEGFERTICDSVSPGVSPKHRHRHNGVTE